MIDTVSSVSNIAFTDKDRWPDGVLRRWILVGCFEEVYFGSCDYRVKIVCLCVSLR